MEKKFLVIGILLSAMLLLGCTSPAPKTEGADPQTAVSSDAATIKITADGFQPKTLEVKAGTTVTFVNEDTAKHWPASAMHPTHTIYPGSGIEKCGTEEAIFDACKGLGQGESFSFTFNEIGSWKYHDHLSVSSTGTIVVE
ncbi:MAG: cupredoxin domain-containing protein [Nanoarchaeota archaeon]